MRLSAYLFHLPIGWKGGRRKQSFHVLILNRSDLLACDLKLAFALPKFTSLPVFLFFLFMIKVFGRSNHTIFLLWAEATYSPAILSLLLRYQSTPLCLSFFFLFMGRQPTEAIMSSSRSKQKQHAHVQS